MLREGKEERRGRREGQRDSKTEKREREWEEGYTRVS